MKDGNDLPDTKLGSEAAALVRKILAIKICGTIPTGRSERCETADCGGAPQELSRGGREAIVWNTG